jgi:ADP-ribose pyrophosphatase YjhB (NUDIX family)
MKPYCYAYPHPAVTTDIVIFTILHERLKLLLIQRGNAPFRGFWSLPGGFVGLNESLDACAARELEEETGISGVYLEQIYSFGAPDRDPRERVISIAYYAMVPADSVHIRAASDASQVGWFDLQRLPSLAFDHQDIVALAQGRLKAKLNYSTIAFQFMPEHFTLGDLQRVYEIILGETLDKRNFRKWMQHLGCVKETGQLRHNGGRRPARLFRATHPGRVEIIR